MADAESKRFALVGVVLIVLVTLFFTGVLWVMIA